MPLGVGGRTIGSLGLVGNTLQIFEQRLEDGVAIGLCHLERATGIRVRFCDERYVLESSYQVEVAEGTQGLCLCQIGTKLALLEVRVFPCYLGRILDDCVAVVDGGIDVPPVCIAIGGIYVQLEDISDGLVAVVATENVVGAYLAPYDEPFHHVRFLQGTVASCHATLHVALGLPEVIACQLRLWLDVKETVAGCHDQRG